MDDIAYLHTKVHWSPPYILQHRCHCVVHKLSLLYSGHTCNCKRDHKNLWDMLKRMLVNKKLTKLRRILSFTHKTKAIYVIYIYGSCIILILVKSYHKLRLCTKEILTPAMTKTTVYDFHMLIRPSEIFMFFLVCRDERNLKGKG
jgi:hypothetical protein